VYRIFLKEDAYDVFYLFELMVFVDGRPDGVLMCLLNLIFLDKILDDEYIDFVDD
jgi:hypothetical protein